MEERITINPKVLAGKPVIKGTRIPVYLILNLVAKGKTFKQIVEEYPELKEDDVVAAINYATSQMKYEEIRPLEVASSPKYKHQNSCFLTNFRSRH